MQRPNHYTTEPHWHLSAKYSLLTACVHVVDADAHGDGEEQNRKRKHNDISPIKWTSADAEAAGKCLNAVTAVSHTAVPPLAYSVPGTCLHQGSHASWKVLDFFLENSRTWKVLENHFGPGKSLKLKPKVLESPGKISLKVMHFSTGSNGKQAAIV